MCEYVLVQRYMHRYSGYGIERCMNRLHRVTSYARSLRLYCSAGLNIYFTDSQKECGEKPNAAKHHLEISLENRKALDRGYSSTPLHTHTHTHTHTHPFLHPGLNNRARLTLVNTRQSTGM